jgi:hypothetical protein
MTEPVWELSPFEQEDENVWGCWISFKDGTHTPVIAKTPEELSRRAHLIAAAPEMYAALKRIEENKWEPDKYHMALSESLRKAEGRND